MLTLFSLTIPAVYQWVQNYVQKQEIQQNLIAILILSILLVINEKTAGFEKLLSYKMRRILRVILLLITGFVLWGIMGRTL